MSSKVITLIVVVLMALIGLIYWQVHRLPKTNSASPASVATTASPPTPAPTPISSPAPTTPTTVLVTPIDQFKQRITKKFFGTYITPQTSPVQPERFSGYHTGVDVEYGDITTDVPVRSIVDGSVVYAQWVSGYGGLTVVKGSLKGRSVYVLYGHVRPSSLLTVGQKVTAGQTIGVLGTAFSHETDGERRHLHFAIYLGPTLDIRGYVQSRGELVNWADPLSYY